MKIKVWLETNPTNHAIIVVNDWVKKIQILEYSIKNGITYWLETEKGFSGRCYFKNGVFYPMS